MDIQSLLKAEPSLENILSCACFESRKDKDAAYVAAKSKVNCLVGYGARNPRLRSETAYNIFINELCERIQY